MALTIALTQLFVNSCMDDENVVIGNIPPTTFDFVEVIEHDGRGPGGWQVAQVAVLLGRLSGMFPRAAICEVEVGMPVASLNDGFISKSTAQHESAVAADRAARKLLGKHTKPTASVCIAFRDEMKEFLQEAISGATVSRFRRWPGAKVPRRSFPPRRGR